MKAKRRRRRRQQAVGERNRTGAESKPLEPSKPRRKPLSRRRKWLFRLTAVTLVPLLFFVLLEVGLRVFGYGYPTGFVVKIDGRDAYTTNHRFGRRFFPPAIAREPVPGEIPAQKGENTYRIFVLGGSAARGTPNWTFGFGRFLQSMLEEQYPRVEFQMVNAGMTAINSHVVLPIARDVACHQPDLFVVYMGNNEVVGPYGSGTVFGGFSPHLSLIRADICLKSTRIGQLMHAWINRRDSPMTDWKGMEMFQEHQVAADDPRLQHVYEHLRANLTEICEVAHGAEASVIVCTVATNVRDTPPFASVHRANLTEAEQARWEELYGAGVAAVEAGQHADAVKLLLKAADVDDRYAELHFLLGHSLLATSRPEEARKHFLLARDLDALRFRADTSINRIIREVAAEQADQGVYLVDAEQAFEQATQTPERLPGNEWFYEHVHPNPEGNYLLARAVFEQLTTILPEAIRRCAANPAAVPSLNCCEVRMPLTPWDRYGMERDIAQMQNRPPFTNQFGHDKRRVARERTLEQLRLQSTSPPALEAASEAYRVALARSPKSLETRVNYATLLAERRDYREAARQWQLLLDRLPDVTPFRMDLGEALRGQGKFEEAIAQFREAMRLSPRVTPVTLLKIGTVLIDERKPAEAEAELRRATAMRPDLFAAHERLGVALMMQDKVSQAAEQFRRALEIDPQAAMVHNNLGVLRAKQGDLTQAVEEFRRALEIDPQAATAHSNLGEAWERQGNLAKAVEHYRQALQIDPNDPTIYPTLAAALVKQGDKLMEQSQPEEALPKFREAFGLNPRNDQAGYKLGILLAQSAKTPEAVEVYRQVLKHSPRCVRAANNLSRILAASEDPTLRNGAEAVRVMETCQTLVHDDPVLLDTLAAAYAEAGQFPKAVAAATQALKLAQNRQGLQLTAPIRARLRLYQHGLPYRGP